MVRLILTLILLTILVVFIGFNVTFRTTVSVFGWRLDDAPTVVVILVSVVAGALLALGFMFSSYLSTRTRKRLAEHKVVARERERQLEAREREIRRVADRMQQPAEAQTATAQPIDTSEPRRMRLLPFLRRPK